MKSPKKKAGLREQQKNRRSGIKTPVSAASTQRLFHELQVHQIELEMQNTELQETRGRMEALLEKYTDLYDFAPVGYFTLDSRGRILEVNLMGAALLGEDRSLLLNRCLAHFVAPTSRPAFLTFLEQVFAGSERGACEAALLKKNGAHFWTNFHAVSNISLSDPQTTCRVAVSDISVLKRGEEAQRHLEILTSTNRGLKKEIVRRLAVERSLKKSQQHQSRLLAHTHQMHNQLRSLSRQFLLAQEEERKKISRELHDVIAQVLTGINVQLTALMLEAGGKARTLSRTIKRTQRLVEKSVDIIHRFARELRPAVLDDLGLIPALHSFLKGFTKTTGIHVRLTTFAEVETLNITKRTILYRVAQEALTNVARHAQASQVEMSIRRFPDSVCMEIKDNGKSFNVEQVLHTKSHKRLGLPGMRERVEMIGGEFVVKSAPNHGTTIQARIPPPHRSILPHHC